MIERSAGERLRPEDRIRRRADFDLAYAEGDRVTSRSFTLIVRASGQDRPRLGVTISRMVGAAVVRNAVRRRLREVFRRNREIIRRPIDIVFHVRPQAAGISLSDLQAEFREAMGRYWARQERRP